MKKLITILEDNNDIRELCTYLLTEEGYEVSSFDTVASLSKVYPETCTDLFLLDIQLPDGNGLEVCEQIKHNPIYANIPVLIMSAQISKGQLPKNSSADGFIEKPFDINRLLKNISSLIHID